MDWANAEHHDGAASHCVKLASVSSFGSNFIRGQGRLKTYLDFRNVSEEAIRYVVGSLTSPYFVLINPSCSLSQTHWPCTQFVCNLALEPGSNCTHHYVYHSTSDGRVLQPKRFQPLLWWERIRHRPSLSTCTPQTVRSVQYSADWTQWHCERTAGYG